MRAVILGKLRTAVAAALRSRGQRSAMFEDFERCFFGEPAAQADPLDVVALTLLEGGERRLAERRLIAALPEPRAIVGLAELDTRRARRRLAALFAAERARLADATQDNGATLLTVAAALWRLAPQPDYVDALSERLRNAALPAERAAAALALGRMRSVEADHALDAALEDTDARVRHCAARALLELHGVALDPSAAQSLADLATAPEAARRADARRERRLRSSAP